MRTVPKLAPMAQAPTACHACGAVSVVWDWQPEDGWARVCLLCSWTPTTVPQPLPFLRNGAMAR